MDAENATIRARVRAAADGQAEWGVHGSALEHRRYMFEVPSRYRNRRRCTCGCGGKVSHAGAANGLTLTGGCEVSMRRWVRTGERCTPAEAERRRAAREAERAEYRARQQRRRARRPARPAPVVVDELAARRTARQARTTPGNAGVPLE